MLAPIEAAWMFLKSQPTERDARIQNEEGEGRVPPTPPWSSTDQGYNPNKELPYPWEEDNHELSEASPAAPPKKLSEFPWQEGPTLGEMADMDPEEVEHYRREAGRRSTKDKRPSGQPTLHDY